MQNNLHINPVRTCRFGLRTLNVEGVHLWATIPNDIKNCSTKQAFSKQLKANLINSYTYRSTYHLIATFQTIIILIFLLILLHLVIIIIIVIIYYYYFIIIILLLLLLLLLLFCVILHVCMFVCMYEYFKLQLTVSTSGGGGLLVK